MRLSRAMRIEILNMKRALSMTLHEDPNKLTNDEFIKLLVGASMVLRSASTVPEIGAAVCEGLELSRSELLSTSGRSMRSYWEHFVDVNHRGGLFPLLKSAQRALIEESWTLELDPIDELGHEFTSPVGIRHHQLVSMCPELRSASDRTAWSSVGAGLLKGAMVILCGALFVCFVACGCSDAAPGGGENEATVSPVAMQTSSTEVSVGLTASGSRDLLELERRAKSKDPIERATAFEQLANLGRGGPDVEPVLEVARRLYTHGKGDTRGGALWVVAVGTQGSPRDVRVLIRALSDASSSDLELAALGLARVGPSAKEALPKLRSLRRRPAVRASIALAISGVGAGDPGACANADRRLVELDPLGIALSKVQLPKEEDGAQTTCMCSFA